MGSEILQRQRLANENEGLDALVAVSPTSVIYTAGFVIPSLRIQGLHRRIAMTVVTADENKKCLIVVDMEANTAAKRSEWLSDIRSYREFEQCAADILVSTLKQYGLAAGRIGLELDYLPAADFALIQNGLPKARFVNVSELLLELRSVKTRSEIDKLIKAGRATDKAHDAVVHHARAGMTEMEVADLITSTIFHEEVEDISLIIVASGDRSVLPNVGPSTRILQPGDIVRIDLLAHVGAYCSDCARTYVVGEPDRNQMATWKALVSTLDAIKSQLRPGVTSSALYKVFTDSYAAFGLKPSRFVGHGLGLSVHEHPWIGSLDRFNRTIEENMVLCIEPYCLTDSEGYQLEDEVLITKNGFDLITNQTNTRSLLQIAA
jgi:Xaa-Pro dipeptidase